MTTVRWKLTEQNGGATTTLLLNPNQMASEPMGKQLTHTTAMGLPARTFQAPTMAQEWVWSGVILTKAHYDQLLLWAKKPGIVEVEDHLGRVFEVLIQSFKPTQRPGRPPGDWKQTYEMSTLFLRRTT